MNEYEMLYVIHPRLAADDIPAMTERVSGSITDSGGEVLSTEPWGRRRLAYPVQHELEGTYVYTTFRLPPEGIGPLEASMVISQDILRHLVVKGVLTAPGSRPPEDMGARASRGPAARTPAAEAPATEQAGTEQAETEQAGTADGAATEAAPPATEAVSAEAAPTDSASVDSPSADSAPTDSAPVAPAAAEAAPAADAPAEDAKAEQDAAAAPEPATTGAD